MNRDDIEEQKALKVQRALQGMWVMYMRHNTSGNGLTPNMAKINGYSIIWHEGAYSSDEPDLVEVMRPDGEVEGYVPIDSLRDVVMGGKL